jgi:DNA-binding beta-propeller fold protein YncE
VRQSSILHAVALATALLLPRPATAQSGGDALLFVGTYDKSIYVIDEATEQVTERIPLRTGIPRSMTLSQDRQRMYVMDVTMENVEVVDIPGRRTLYTFSLSKAGEQVRIWGFNVEPQERYAVMLAKTYRRKPDRFEVSGPLLLRYDLQQHAVTDTIKWPQGREQEGAGMIFSPSGDHLYFMGDSAIIVLETEGFTEVDRWDYGTSLDQGMGRFEFGFSTQPYDESGFHTGLFRYTDPVQNRRMMGVARVNLVDRSVDFFPIGPNESVGFTLAPDGRRAYGLRQEVGNYEFYTFDLENRRVSDRTRFAGRPRMGLMTSSNGNHLYIFIAGNTIDVYDATTFRYLRTIELDADTTTGLIVLPKSLAAPRGP